MLSVLPMVPENRVDEACRLYLNRLAPEGVEELLDYIVKLKNNHGRKRRFQIKHEQERVAAWLGLCKLLTLNSGAVPYGKLLMSVSVLRLLWKKKRCGVASRIWVTAPSIKAEVRLALLALLQLFDSPNIFENRTLTSPLEKIEHILLLWTECMIWVDFIRPSGKLQSQSKVKLNFIELMQHSTVFCFSMESENTHVYIYILFFCDRIYFLPLPNFRLNQKTKGHQLIVKMWVTDRRG